MTQTSSYYTRELAVPVTNSQKASAMSMYYARKDTTSDAT